MVSDTESLSWPQVTQGPGSVIRSLTAPLPTHLRLEALGELQLRPPGVRTQEPQRGSWPTSVPDSGSTAQITVQRRTFIYGCGGNMARAFSWPAKGQSVETENRFPSQVLGRGKEVAGLCGVGCGGWPAWCLTPSWDRAKNPQVRRKRRNRKVVCVTRGLPKAQWQWGLLTPRPPANSVIAQGLGNTAAVQGAGPPSAPGPAISPLLRLPQHGHQVLLSSV